MVFSLNETKRRQQRKEENRKKKKKRKRKEKNLLDAVKLALEARIRVAVGRAAHDAQRPRELRVEPRRRRRAVTLFVSVASGVTLSVSVGSGTCDVFSGRNIIIACNV